jgi:hypothetical protein
MVDAINVTSMTSREAPPSSRLTNPFKERAWGGEFLTVAFREFHAAVCGEFAAGVDTPWPPLRERLFQQSLSAGLDALQGQVAVS